MATSQVLSTPLPIQQKPRRVAGVVISGHGFQHMYADGFLVLQDFIYQAFGLTPVTFAFMHTVRQAASGLSSMGGGFVIDMFAGKRGILLSSSLFMMGFGYLLVAAAPNYGLLLLALAFGAAAASFWHPVGLGILSYTFPRNRAFVVSLHRSSGNIGELITPVLVGFVLAFITWRQVLLSGFFLMTVVSMVLLVSLSRIGLKDRASEKRGVGAQFRSLGQLFQSRALPVLLLVSGFRGMADRAFVPFLPLFIAESLRRTNPAVSDAEIGWVTGLYFGLLAGAGIFATPLIGALSDRIGRRPVMIAVLAITTLLLVVMWQAGLGLIFGVAITALGAVRFAINNLTQAASLDVAEGRRLEGSMIGLLWGNNALFGAFSPLLLGLIIMSVGGENFELIFPYAIALHVVTFVTALFLPQIGGRKKTEVVA